MTSSLTSRKPWGKRWVGGNQTALVTRRVWVEIRFSHVDLARTRLAPQADTWVEIVSSVELLRGQPHPCFASWRKSLPVWIGKPKSLADLAASTGLSMAAVSQHLGVLRDSGMVVTQAFGRSRCHTLTSAGAQLIGNKP